MTSHSSNMTGAKADALEESGFDPSARQVDSAGRTFVDFFAALNGEVDSQDDCNARIAALLRAGRSEAFCREYRKCYDGAAHSIEAVAREGKVTGVGLDSQTRALCASAGLNRACDRYPEDKERPQLDVREVREAIEHIRQAFPEHRPEEIAATPGNRAHIAGFARATKLHGEYHEA